MQYTIDSYKSRTKEEQVHVTVSPFTLPLLAAINSVKSQHSLACVFDLLTDLFNLLSYRCGGLFGFVDDFPSDFLRFSRGTVNSLLDVRLGI